MNLLNWVDSYESVLKRAGFNDVEYTFLKQKAQHFLPDYFEYLQKQSKDSIIQMIVRDRNENQTMQAITALIEGKKELLS